MTKRSSVARLLLLLLALALPSLRAQDELGLGRMWTFHAPPVAWLKRTYDFAPDPSWFDAVRLATLRFGVGCSASFVSPHGLILTNHHCVSSALARVDVAADLVRDGFVSQSYADELRLPDLKVEQLVAMRDVSAAIESGIEATDDPAIAAEKRSKNERRVLDEANAASPKLRSQVVSMFHGAQWQLYQYRVFDDVRLVMAPHLQIAHFGGDPDNFVYPRYSIDFAFCRAWEGDAPADTTSQHFAFGDGPSEGQLVFLSGNPGRTQRLLGSQQLEYLRDVRYPRLRELIDHRLQILRTAIDSEPVREAKLRPSVLSYENGQKLYRLEHGALLDPAFMATKVAGEAKLQARLAADAALSQRFGGLFDRIAEIAALRRTSEGRLHFHSAGNWAPLQRALVLAEFAETGKEDVLRSMGKIRGNDDADLQRAFFVDHLDRARHWLPTDDPYLAVVLGDDEPRAVIERLRATVLVDAAQSELLGKAGADVVRVSDDPMLRLARSLRPIVETARRESEALELRERTVMAQFGQAVFAVYGDSVSADASMTPRLSDGRVRGYEYNGTIAPWRTLMQGLFARSSEFDGRPPFDLPQPWRDAMATIDPLAPVDFVCTCDATGGNSGSPVIDVNRRLVGLLFDGNIESLGNEFLFRESKERSVCVHPRAILEALEKVYAAPALIRELRAESR
ncbi:MAG: S46 family peptidase [Planctomycetota bacterium]